MCNIVRVALSLMLLALPLAPLAREGGEGPEAAHRRACNHYDNRARFLPRQPSPAFVVVLADSCRAAVSSLSSRATSPDARARAVEFLDRLVAFEALVIEMNVERAFGPAPDPRSRLLHPWSRPVSATGEYLIARDMGVIRAWRDWIEVGPDFAGPMLPGK